MYTNADGKLKTWSAAQVAAFRFTDKKTKQLRFFQTIKQLNRNGIKVPVMYERIYQGKLSILRRDLLYRVNSGVYVQDFLAQIPFSYKVQDFNHYVLDRKGNIRFFEPTEKSVTAILSKKESQIKAYIKEHKIKFKTTADLISLFQYYDTL